MEHEQHDKSNVALGIRCLFFVRAVVSFLPFRCRRTNIIFHDFIRALVQMPKGKFAQHHSLHIVKFGRFVAAFHSVDTVSIYICWGKKKVAPVAARTKTFYSNKNHKNRFVCPIYTQPTKCEDKQTKSAKSVYIVMGQGR